MKKNKKIKINKKNSKKHSYQIILYKKKNNSKKKIKRVKKNLYLKMILLLMKA